MATTQVTRLIGKRQYCEIVGKSPATIRSHAISYRMPCGQAKVDPHEMLTWIHEWFTSNYRLLRRLKMLECEESKAEADRRKAIAAASREELRLGRERRELIDRREAEKHAEDLCRLFVACTERAGADLAAKLAGLAKHEIKTSVEDYFYQMRQDIVDGKPIDAPEKTR